MPDRIFRASLFAGCLLLLLCLVAVSPSIAKESVPTVAATDQATAPSAAAVADETAGLCAADGLSLDTNGPLELFVGPPKPAPDYCEACRPCTKQADCGLFNGYYLGVCFSNPNYCGSPGYSACVCY